MARPIPPYHDVTVHDPLQWPLCVGRLPRTRGDNPGKFAMCGTPGAASPHTRRIYPLPIFLDTVRCAASPLQENHRYAVDLHCPTPEPPPHSSQAKDQPPRSWWPPSPTRSTCIMKCDRLSPAASAHTFYSTRRERGPEAQRSWPVEGCMLNVGDHVGHPWTAYVVIDMLWRAPTASDGRFLCGLPVRVKREAFAPP